MSLYANNKSYTEQKIPLSSFVPRILSEEEFSAYDDEFTFVFSDPNIRNIALSGQYGAGKSSVMRTLEKRGIKNSQGHRYIFVSLANFGEAGSKDRGQSADTSSSNTHRIEEKILMQLVHQLDGKETPKSRFARTVDAGQDHDVKVAIEFTSFVALSIALFRWYGKETIAAQLLPYVLTLSVVWMTLLGFFIYQMIRRNSIAGLLRKLKIGSFEIAFGEGNNVTPLDRHMDDLVYLINASGRDVIVFEDLDRFGSIELFKKLREINELANATRLDAKTNPVRFFYLIRDGLFPDARDRTKFFDFIIPIVPFVDPSNAEAILSRRLESTGVEIDQTFLYQLGLFIDDPRILNDIANEFMHYMLDVLPSDEGRIGADEHGRLLAIIALKSLFPRDFELLQSGRGCLATLLAKRKWLIKRCAESSTERMREIDETLDRIRYYGSLSEDELTMLYGFNALAQRSGSFSNFFLNSTPSQSNPHKFIKTIRENDALKKEFEQIKASLTENSEYQLRVQNAVDRTDKLASRLESEREEIRKQVADIERMSLSDLLNRTECADEFFALTEEDFQRREDFAQLEVQATMASPDYPLIRFLLASGMIDDSYRRYTSYLHPGGIDLDDADFVVAVLQGKETDECRIIHDPKAVLNRLDTRNLMKRSARNRTLFASLIEVDDERTKAFVKGIDLDRDYQFLAKYISSDQYKRSVFGTMKKHLGITAADLAEDENLEVGIRRDVCHRFMADRMDEGSESKDLIRRVGAFASSDPGFLELRVVEADAVSSQLACIGYKPATLDFTVSSERLLRTIVDKGLFEPNANLVDALIEWDEKSVGSLSQGKLATKALEREGSLFFSTVENNLSVFVGTMVKNCPPEGLQDDENAIIWILGSSSISDELAESFARVEHGDKIQSLDALSEVTRKGLALKYDLAECNSANVLGYVGDTEDLDDKLAVFLERNGLPKDLTRKACEKTLGSGDAFVNCSAMTTEKIPISLFSSIVTTCATKYQNFRLIDVPDERLSSLIELGSIEMNKDNLKFLRTYYKEHVYEFAVHEFDGYIEIVFQDSFQDFRDEEALKLLKERDLPVAGQLSLLKGFTENVKVSDKYANEVNAKIIEKHFDSSDLETIIKMHRSSKDLLKDAIEMRVADSLTQKNMRSYTLTPSLTAGVLERMEDKAFGQHLLIAQLGLSQMWRSAREEVCRCLRACGRGSLVDAMSGSKTRLAQGEADANIIKALVDLGMLSPKSKQESNGGWKVYKHGTGRVVQRTPPL